MKRRIGVVADDITGANDIGIMFSKNGLRSVVIPMEKLSQASEPAKCADVVIVDTDSRFDSPEEAARKVRAVTQQLMGTGFDLYHNKTCSVFRGNIGAEFDAMQDVLGVECSMVVLGLPKLGRTTVGGVHYLNGVRLDKSGFINDPIHPTTEPELIKILAKQSSRKSALFPAQALDSSFAKQIELLEGLKTDNAYIIFDVRDQDDLRKIAALIKDEKNICGSSGIAEELPAAWGQQSAGAGETLPISLADETGCLVLAGSLTNATKAQVNYLHQEGWDSFKIDPERIITGQSKELIEEAVSQAVARIMSGRPFLVYTENDPEHVRSVKETAFASGMDDAELGKRISGVMGSIANGVVSATGSRKLVVAGGDTSKAVSGALGLTHMLILKEIEPGVPAMYGYGDDSEMLLVFKSGSFGSDAFLHKAAYTLQNLQSGRV